MLNILFVLYSDYNSNSAAQVHNIANALEESGNSCIVAVPSDKESIDNFKGYRCLYLPLDYEETLKREVLFPNGKAPSILHAWTPRELVRKQSHLLKEKFPSAKLIIHLEDNEEYILEKTMNQSIGILNLYSDEDMQTKIPSSLAYPRIYKHFLEEADGITTIMDTLSRFVPKNIPHMILWPIVDMELFRPQKKDYNLIKELGLNSDHFILCYPGNVHIVNTHEVRSLYLAVALANREKIPVRLIRTGRNYSQFLGDNPEWAHKYSIELGFVPRNELISIISLADLLIQPGRSNGFNDYRLPSKIPEFLSMGKPVSVPDTNIGRFLKNKEEALLLRKGDSLEILRHIKILRDDKKLGENMAVSARKFALNNFNKESILNRLDFFYKKINRV